MRGQESGVDFYAVLGVSPGATDKEIDTAYRALSRRLHPDVTGGDDEQQKLVNLAHDTLKDPRRRREHDALRRIRQEERLHPEWSTIAHPAPFPSVLDFGWVRFGEFATKIVDVYANDRQPGPLTANLSREGGTFWGVEALPVPNEVRGEPVIARYAFRATIFPGADTGVHSDTVAVDFGGIPATITLRVVVANELPGGRQQSGALSGLERLVRVVPLAALWSLLVTLPVGVVLWLLALRHESAAVVGAVGACVYGVVFVVVCLLGFGVEEPPVDDGHPRGRVGEGGRAPR